MHCDLPIAISAIDAGRVIPLQVWWRFALAIGALVVVVCFCRWIVRVNRVLLLLLILVGGSSLFLGWLRNRDEPRLLTPLMDRLSLYFPS